MGICSLAIWQLPRPHARDGGVAEEVDIERPQQLAGAARPENPTSVAIVDAPAPDVMGTAAVAVAEAFNDIVEVAAAGMEAAICTQQVCEENIAVPGIERVVSMTEQKTQENVTISETAPNAEEKTQTPIATRPHGSTHSLALLYKRRCTQEPGIFCQNV
mmetsp:Transcript_69020/g.179264  ORF Transcript_69020/g.179264 Transcript_69020/m.179264 type:complete len:160 (+) Transcript_69020:284-763(+)